MMKRSTGVVLSIFMCGAVTGGARAQWDVRVLRPQGPVNSWVNAGDETILAGRVGPLGAEIAALWDRDGSGFVSLNPAQSYKSQVHGMDAGRQVGTATLTGQGHRAGYWSGTAASWRSLHPKEAASSFGYAINGARIAGRVTDAERYRATLWEGDTFGTRVDLHPAGADESSATGLDGERVYGHARFDVQTHAGYWTDDAGSFVSMHPASAGSHESLILSARDGVQVGYTHFDNNPQATMWRGDAESWTLLRPAMSTRSEAVATDGEYQVGWADLGPTHQMASIWQGTPGSWESLRACLPGVWRDTFATSIWRHDGMLYVSGHGFNEESLREEALLWWRPIPNAGTGAVVMLGLAIHRRRRRFTSS